MIRERIITSETDEWEYGIEKIDGNYFTDWCRLKKGKDMARKEMTPYTPPNPDTKKSWQTKIRKQRRVYFETLPVDKRAEFIKRIWYIRTKGD